MYENFFKLEERPFSLTPNTRYWYLSEPHDHALKTLLYGVSARVGFMLLTGEVGSGKTTTVRALLNRLQDEVETSLILNPLISTEELVKSINRDFGCLLENGSLSDQIESLNRHLISINSSGKTALVIIDESQNLSFESFEMARMLSNLETESQKLLNILFVGQPELIKRIRAHELRQLAQRVQIHVQLTPLSLSETISYIEHRLQMAGEHVSAKFAPDAMKQIYKKSKGIPRLINSICDMSLLAAFSENKHLVDKKLIKRAIKEVPFYVHHS